MTAAREGSTAGAPPGGRLRTVLLAVIGVGLLLFGGGLGFAIGVGQDRAPGAGSVDAGFARDMSAHHLQAVEMANVALGTSTDVQVRGLAFDIAETQQNQVGRMQGWLSLWGLPLTGGDPMAWMDGGDHAGHAAGGPMPGMATEEELAELRSLTGEEFDVRFLQLMTRHHQGGTEMARFAADNAREPVVANLATKVLESQGPEARLMTGMLADRGAEPLPAP